MTRRLYGGLCRIIALLSLCLSFAGATCAQDRKAAQPIRIGFSMSLSGPLASFGKVALLSMEMWRDDTNAKGGLLGRPVQFVYYDDQTNGANVPNIYAKLINADKVDLIIGPFATNMTAPALPVVMRSGKVLVSLWCGDCNRDYRYDRYFSMSSTGPDTGFSFTEGFFAVAMQQNPRPQTIAIVSADGEASHVIAGGARAHAKKAGLRIVYERSYPLTSVDLAPVVRGVQAANPDIVLIASYPLDSVAMVRAFNEIGYRPNIVGGGMNGLPNPALKAQLGPLLNGFVNYEFWVPAPGLDTPAVRDFIKRYREKAAAQGVDPIGLYVPPWAYSYIQVLGDAVKAVQSLDDKAIADYLRTASFDTLVGKFRFGEKGEWAKSRMFTVQYRGIKGNDIEQFKNLDTTEVILWPAEYATGKLIYPYEKAR